jgi:hypothetical protein
MKYHQLFIRFKNSAETYAAVTKLLGKTPIPAEPSKLSSNIYAQWHYQVDTNEGDEPFHFIYDFLDILEGNYEALAALGIQREDILFWLVYEYDEQCALEFHPQEMRRMGENGIHLNIDCHQMGTSSIQRNS